MVKKSCLRQAENSEICIQLILNPNSKMDLYEIKILNMEYCFIYSHLFIYFNLFIETHFPFPSIVSELKDNQSVFACKISLSIPNK